MSDVLSLEKDPPFGWPVLSRDHIEKSGLPRPIRTDDRFEGVRKDFEIDVVHCDVATELDGQVLCLDDWGLTHDDSENKVYGLGLRQ